MIQAGIQVDCHGFKGNTVKHAQLSLRDLNQIIIYETLCGKTRDDLVGYLRERGWPEQSARAFIHNTLSREQTKVSFKDDAKADARKTGQYVDKNGARPSAKGPTSHVKPAPVDPSNSERSGHKNDHDPNEELEDRIVPVPSNEPLMWALIATGILFLTLSLIGALPSVPW